jgi:hypothetical protein
MWTTKTKTKKKKKIEGPLDRCLSIYATPQKHFDSKVMEEPITVAARSEP